MIINDARIARNRLQRAYAASSSVEEAEALSKKRIELQTYVEKVGTLADLRSLMRLRGVSLSDPPEVQKIKQSCDMLRSRFTEAPKAATLVDKQRWSKLIELLTKFSVEEETLQKQDWKGYCGSKLFGGAPPEQREQTILRSLPENQRALELYSKLYRQLVAYRSMLPRNAIDLQNAQEISKQLSEIRFIENDDVPVSVRQFFNATSSGTGANLEFLTVEVMDWLRLNAMLDKFAIRAR